jgi:hypothetical protein
MPRRHTEHGHRLALALPCVGCSLLSPETTAEQTPRKAKGLGSREEREEILPDEWSFRKEDPAPVLLAKMT